MRFKKKTMISLQVKKKKPSGATEELKKEVAIDVLFLITDFSYYL